MASQIYYFKIMVINYTGWHEERHQEEFVEGHEQGFEERLEEEFVHVSSPSRNFLKFRL